MKRAIIRYRIDFISVAVVMAVLSIQLLAVVRMAPWYTAVVILLLIRHVSLVEHNHAHLSVFRPRILNEILGWLCFLSNGIPLEFYRLHHVRNHHRYNQRFESEERDWSSTFGFQGASFPDSPIGKVYYVATFPLITICTCLIELLRSPGSRRLRRFATSIAIVAFISILLCVINWTGFVTFFAFPWLIVFFGHGFNNYDQHKGCSMADPINSANESLSFRGKSIWFNIGYHIEHHMKPDLHWSQLPKLHNQISHLIPPERFQGIIGTSQARRI